jgi:hypothetical protein
LLVKMLAPAGVAPLVERTLSVTLTMADRVDTGTTAMPPGCAYSSHLCHSTNRLRDLTFPFAVVIARAVGLFGQPFS